MKESLWEGLGEVGIWSGPEVLLRVKGVTDTLGGVRSCRRYKGCEKSLGPSPIHESFSTYFLFEFVFRSDWIPVRDLRGGFERMPGSVHQHRPPLTSSGRNLRLEMENRVEAEIHVGSRRVKVPLYNF